MSVESTTVRSIVGGTELSERNLSEIKSELSENLENSELSNSMAVRDTFLWAVEEFQNVNVTDLWNYGLYRNYLSLVGDSTEAGQQSWRNVSGTAFEHFVVSYYNERLPRYLRLAHVTDTEVGDVLSAVTGEKASSVADAVLLGNYNGEWHAFGGVNTLTSFKGRLRNYTGCSDALRKAGLSSFVVTLDAHIPRGSIRSEGELSSDSNVAELVGEHALFDGLFSFNQETEEVSGVAPIQNVGQTRFNDAFIGRVTEEWEEFVQPLVSTRNLRV